MRHDILVFDLDGTLCEVGKGMLPEDTALLCRLEDAGFTIVVCSGKPTYYLCGFLRQAGLTNPIMVGENGAVVQFGIGLPPERYAVYPYDRRQKEILARLREEIDAACPDTVWYQPNDVQLTPFPRDAKAFDKIREILSAHSEELKDLQVYEQNDCFDIVPAGINKQNGLRLLSQMLGADSSRFLVVGDGANDIPMFQFGDFSILIRSKGREAGVDVNEMDLNANEPDLDDDESNLDVNEPDLDDDESNLDVNEPDSDDNEADFPETDVDLLAPDIRAALEYIWENERKEN